MEIINAKYFESKQGDNITLFDDDFKLYRVKKFTKTSDSFSRVLCNLIIYDSVEVGEDLYEVNSNNFSHLKKHYNKDVRTIYEIEYDFKELNYEKVKSRDKLIIYNPDKFDFIVAENLIQGTLKKYLIKDRKTNMTYYINSLIFERLQEELSKDN